MEVGLLAALFFNVLFSLFCSVAPRSVFGSQNRTVLDIWPLCWLCFTQEYPYARWNQLGNKTAPSPQPPPAYTLTQQGMYWEVCPNFWTQQTTTAALSCIWMWAASQNSIPSISFSLSFTHTHSCTHVRLCVCVIHAILIHLRILCP